MFPNISLALEETIAPQSPPVFIGLTNQENQLLSGNQKSRSHDRPHLARALATRIQQFAGSYNILPMNHLEIQWYLQDWFMQLFQSRDTSFFDRARLEKINQLVLLTGIDLILAYAQETIKGSSKPEEAAEAFG